MEMVRWSPVSGGEGGCEHEAKGKCMMDMVDQGSVESKRYYLARRTLLQMLTSRGYVVPDFDTQYCASLSAFRAVFGDKPDFQKLCFVVHRAFDPARKILVIFCGTQEIKKKTIVGILAQVMNKETLDRVILVLENKMNCYAQRVVDEYSVKVETLQITELLTDVMKHVIQPKIEVLSPEEKQELLNKYKVEGQQLPHMLQNDAVARYYGLEKGQVVKISYHDGIAESFVTYRSVI